MSTALSMKLLQMLQTERADEKAGSGTAESSSASTQCVSSSSTATRSSNEDSAAARREHCEEHDDSRVSLLSEPSTAADSPAGVASPHQCVNKSRKSYYL